MKKLFINGSKITKGQVLLIVVMTILLVLSQVSCTSKYVTSNHSGIVIDHLPVDTIGGKAMYPMVVKEFNNPEKQIVARPHNIYELGDTLCWIKVKSMVNK